jgi:tRNA (cmo5U34)-methyltransferase
VETNERVKNRFNAVASEYEATRKKFIPDFDTFYESGLRFLQCEKPAPRVLDFGAGTGLYAHKLLERYPRAQITLIDFAGNMLEIAGQIFNGNQNIRFIQDDYTSHDFGEEKFDIIISALSIHHFNNEEKKKIYGKVFSLLCSGGEFLNAEQISAASEALDERYRKIHAEIVKKNTDKPRYEQFLKNIELDKRSPVSSQLDWLNTIGFAQTDCIFKLYCFAVIYARK